MKAIFSLGLLCVLFVCTISIPNISAQQTDKNNFCIVNVTEINCTKCSAGTYQTDPDDPSMFFQCSNGLLYPKHCEPNTVWDERTETCIYKDNDNLNESCIVNITETNCTKCIQGSYAPYPDDPTMFYQCVNGQLYPMNCKPNTIWNQTVHTCVADEIISTNPFDSDTVTSTPTAKHSSTTSFMTTSESSSQSFDGASFGGGICAGFGISLLVLLLVRCCCSSSGKSGYDQHI